jgi:hypothetical protein
LERQKYEAFVAAGEEVHKLEEEIHRMWATMDYRDKTARGQLKELREKFSEAVKAWNLAHEEWKQSLEEVKGTK